MKEIPILMRPEMARATNKEIKFETRRLSGLKEVNLHPDQWFPFRTRLILEKPNEWVTEQIFQNKKDASLLTIKCPYGMTNDLLWVRESWNKDGHGGYRYVSDYPDHGSLIWKPCIHMHKAIARTWCQVTDIQVERLHDITRDGAKDEGIDIFFDRFTYRIPTKYKAIMITTDDPVEAYLSYVNSINGLTIKDNPWVWVVKYQVLSVNGKPSMAVRKEVMHG